MNTAITKRRIAMLVAGALSLGGIALAGQAFAQAANTGSTTGTGATAAPLVINGVNVVNGDPRAGTATVTWTTNVPATTQIFYGLSRGAYTSSTTIDNTLTTDHVAMMTNLGQNETYHFVASSDDANGANMASADQVLTMPGIKDGILNPSGTTAINASTTLLGAPFVNSNTNTNAFLNGPVMNGTVLLGTAADLPTLENMVIQLENQVNALRTEVSAMGGGTVSSSNSSNTSTNASTTASSAATQGAATITPSSSSVRNGSTVDFTGRGFWNNEPVTVMSNGTTIATAQADGGGNFSTGSLPVYASNGGSQTYTFTGQWSGITGSATVSTTP
ncbi:MAG TPA: hypothetical protein VFT82_03895 [Candidatus Paceibacterota bacterium]|nr:hypothetical protein [Candidatus Paceibacterota bacterium]